MAGSLLVVDNMQLQSCRLSNSHSYSSYPQSLESLSCRQPHLRKINNNKLYLKKIIFSGRSECCYRLKPVSAFSSEDAYPISQESEQVRGKNFEQWDSLTAKFAGAANLPFLLLQLPQIILNTRNLLAGNKSALLAVPWLGMFTGLLGNLSLLSYFIKKRETEAVVVQLLGVISMYVVLLQLAMAEAMPLPHFIGTSIVMWSTFVPYIPDSVLPSLIAFVTAVVAVFMARVGKLSEKGIKILGSLSGWTATLLFMWMPVAQMWTNLLNPENIRGLSPVTMLLAMIGNGLMIPRALFIRDLMWFTGSSWAFVSMDGGTSYAYTASTA